MEFSTRISRTLGLTGRPAEKPDNGMLRVTSGRFRPEIDGLRFFAIIPVMFSHFFQQVLRRQNQLGFLDDHTMARDVNYLVNHLPGVLLFFAISGYILTYQITNASKGGYSWSKYKEYIIRRFKRIAPPYYIVLIGTFIIVGVIGFQPSGWRHFEGSDIPLVPSLIVSIFYAHWLVYGEWPRIFGAGWTLEVETQYYVIAPLLTLIYLRLSNKIRRAIVGFAAIFLTSLMASQYEVGNYWSGTIFKFFPYFLTGMLALDLQDDLREIVRKVPALLTNALTVFVVLLYLHVQAPESGAGMEMFKYYAINIPCVLAMFVAVSVEGNILRRICVNRFVVIIGGACYSIYMTHHQVFFALMSYFTYRHFVFEETYMAMIVNAVLGIPLALLVGLAFYRFVERPFMLWGRQKDRPRTSAWTAQEPLAQRETGL